MDNLKRITKTFANNVVKGAKKNLAQNQRRSLTITTDKDGNQKRSYTKFPKINTSGTLNKSIQHKIVDTDIAFYFEDYGINIDRGVMGNKRRVLPNWQKSIFLPRESGYGSKMPPVNKIKTWASKKGIASGNIASFSFAVAKKIQQHGTAPKLFFTDAFNPEYEDLLDKIEPAVGEDIEDKLS